MNPKILCTWLGLPEKCWPPDHYTLLGLGKGEGDVGRIEQIVHERMAKLRCYQCSHPEEATEGMNRLAQAFISLTDQLTKQAATSKPAEKPIANGKAAAKIEKVKDDTLSGDKTVSDWHVAPPPVRIGPLGEAKPKSSSDILASAPTPPAEAPVAKSDAPPQSPPAASIDVCYELAHKSTEAKRGIGTLAFLIERIYQTRQLILAWNQVGRHLSEPAKKLTRAADEADLTRGLEEISGLMSDYPAILGHPGKPGYRVVAMGRLALTGPMFKMLDAGQREALARDWDEGYRVLLSHRQFLRQQFKTLRRRGILALAMKAVRGAINDHPGWVALGASLVIALVVCLWVFVF